MQINQEAIKGIVDVVAMSEVLLYTVKYFVYSSAINKAMMQYKNKREEGEKELYRLAKIGNAMQWLTPIDIIVSSYINWEYQKEQNKSQGEKQKCKHQRHI